jgi:hypothetical protein
MYAVLDALGKSARYSSERIRNCPNEAYATSAAIEEWHNRFPYKSERDFILPAIQAVLEPVYENYEYGVGWDAVGGAWSPKATAEAAISAVEFQKAHYAGDRPYMALRRVKGKAPGPWEEFS